MKNILNHAMKTTKLPNPETQARIQQVKLGVDWHADHFRVARVHTGTGPPGNAHAGKPESRAEIAEQSFVLLKNDQQILPLKKSGIIALVGPLADDQEDVLGCWHAAGDGRQAVSVLTRISNVAGSSVTILRANGANLIDDPALRATLKAFGAEIPVDGRSPREMLAEAVEVAARADVVVAVLGESAAMSGEAASRSEIGLPECQEQLLRALVKTGKPLVLVLMNGRPLTLTWEAEHCGAILETWFGSTEAGNAVADVLFGDYNPSGKLTATFPRDVGQIPIYYNHKNTGRPYKGDPVSEASGCG
jgi:beta-glucosidase